MVSVLDQPQAKPSPTVINQLKRIGELKASLGPYEHEACGALGLQAQLSSLAREPGTAPMFWKRRHTPKEGFQRLRATVGSTIRFDAWRESSKAADWNVVVYAPGPWEDLCQPTLRLVQWLHEWGGLRPEMQLTLQVAVEKFKNTGNLPLRLRQETGGRLCGRCGEEVRDLHGHIHSIHDRPNAQSPLGVFIKVRDGRKSVMVAQGNGHQQHMWTIPEELHRPELKDPRFRPGLADDLDRTFHIAGKSHSFPKNGKFPLPDDITPLPYLASALRRLTKGDVLLSN